MNTADFDDIFTNYYTLYRAEADPPATTDAEYTIGLRLANNAVSRWANYDGTYWKELFDTNQEDGTGAQTVTSGDSIYSAPTNMREAGGLIKIKNSSGQTVRTYQIIDPQEAQFRDDNSQYAYFTGDPTNGFTLHLNPAPDTAVNGMDIDYVYYKKPTLFADGNDKTELPNPWFIVHHMLANRLRASNNYGSYQIALRDAEEALKNMQHDNNSGSWANPWALADNTGTVFGQ